MVRPGPGWTRAERHSAGGCACCGPRPGSSPTELAAAAGLDPATYRRAEAGDPATLTYLDLVALADALAVPADSLLADLA